MAINAFQVNDDVVGDKEASVVEAATALSSTFPANSIPASAIQGIPGADDDVDNVTFTVSGGNLNVSVTEGGATVSGSLTVVALAAAIASSPTAMNSIMLALPAAFNALSPAQRNEWNKAAFSSDGSMWSDASGRVGEDDGLRNTAGYTNIADL